MRPLALLGLGAAMAVLALASPAARAADLSGSDPRVGAGSPYDDPRYADIYGAPRRYDPPPVAQNDDYYDRRYDAPPVPREPVYRDDPRLRPYVPDWREDPYRRRAEVDPACTPREEIRRHLISGGWRDFRDLALEGNLAVIGARRPDGRPFELRLDRCTGVVVNVRPLDPYARPYADRGPPPPRPF